MSSPRFTVIVPAPSIHPEPAILRDLAKLASPEVEVLVVTGSNPSRQRNLAAARATGEILAFCDSDCRIDQAWLDRIDAHVSNGREVIGGPVLLEEPALPKEHLFQNLLGFPLLTGGISARYRAGGTLRSCDDSQLILCNMAVRRALFEQHGGFQERLYPNEENEWVSRLRARGVECWHDPAIGMRRPQRKSWAAFSRMLLGYGSGRTKQFLVTGKWDLKRQLPPLALVGWVILLLKNPALAIKLAVAGWLTSAVAARCVSADGTRLSNGEALCAPIVPLFYGLGQVQGFFRSTRPAPAGTCVVYRWDAARAVLIPCE